MFARILKHNPYHGPDGKFTDSDAATFVSTSGVFAARRNAKPKGGGGGGGGVDSRTYVSVNTDQDFAKDHQKQLGSLDSDVLEAVKTYTGSKYADMNNYHRSEGTAEVSDDIKRLVGLMDTAFKEVAGVGKDIEAYRGVTGKTGARIKAALDAGTLEGSTLTDKGYTSTSTSLAVARSWGGVVVNLKIPKESKGLYVGASDLVGGPRHSGIPREREMILDRGGTMRFTGGRKDGGTYIVDAIWEPPKRGKS